MERKVETNGRPRFYLAYGSNLDMRGMRERCPGARPVVDKHGRPIIIWLEDARLVFRGVADIQIEAGQVAPCGLWLITPENEAQLDRYEGVSRDFYTKETVDIGDGRTALIYMMTATGIYPPSQYYYDVIVRGYRDFRIPLKYLRAARFYSWKGKDPCEQTIARRRRQKNSSHQQRLVPMPESLKARQLKLRLEHTKSQLERAGLTEAANALGVAPSETPTS